MKGVFTGLRAMLDDLEQVMEGVQKDAKKLVDEAREDAKAVWKDFERDLATDPKDPPTKKACPRCGKVMAFRDVSEMDTAGVVTRTSVYECLPCHYRLDRVYRTSRA
jgi:hypothetical protein